MLKELVEYLENKNIVILGFQREGKSMYQFLRKHFPSKSIAIADKRNNIKEEIVEDTNLEYYCGENYLENLDKFDLIIKTPGISLKDINKSKILDKITSQYELFLEFFDKCLTIGITGTKGKSTTSTLMYEVLKSQKEDVKFLGNIGVPIFEEIEDINENTIVVLELSSHALEYARRSPKIGILLNIYPEHLDFYSSFYDYSMAKFNIQKYQNENDYFIYNMDNETIENTKFNIKTNDIKVSMNNTIPEENKVYLLNDGIYFNKKKLMDTGIELKLKGKHNLNNIMFVLAVSEILNLNLSLTIETIKNMKSLPHRLEFVGKINGVEYYNDSIATVPEATIEGVKALEKVNTLIVGGHDRGLELQSLIEFLKSSDIQNIICLSTTGKYIYDGLKGASKKIFKTEQLEEAVRIAKKVTEKNMICLLSPAASSYNQFKNFEDRGNKYKEYVLKK